MRYNKQGMREELRNALLVVPRSKGQLEGFENCGSSDSRFQKTRAGAQPIRTLACRTFKTSPMPLAPQAFKHSKLVQAMNEARKCVSDWLRYCYSDGAQLPTKSLLQELLINFAEQESRKLRGASVELIKHLALLACQQKRHQINVGTSLLTHAKIAQLAGKTEKAWHENWAERWERLLRILDGFDIEGLDHVHEWGRGRKVTREYSDLSLQHCVPVRTGSEMATSMAL